MKCQNVKNNVPCEHEALFILRPQCCKMYLCEYCAAYARIFTDDILEIAEGITFEQAAQQNVHLTAFGDQPSASIPLQIPMFADDLSAINGGR